MGGGGGWGLKRLRSVREKGRSVQVVHRCRVPYVTVCFVLFWLFLICATVKGNSASHCDCCLPANVKGSSASGPPMLASSASAALVKEPSKTRHCTAHAPKSNALCIDGGRESSI